MRIWLGTSGYSYAEWVGDFYPSGTRAERMLAYYCRWFPVVELNFSFYRLPTADQLRRLAEATPAGFQFLVKLPRTLSHERDPRDVPAFRHAAEALSERGQLLGLLCQLPQAFHDGRDERAWIEQLGNALGDLSLAVEFRHCSWDKADVPDWMRERGLDLVSVDVPDIPALYPRRLVQSGRCLYVRLHSRSAENWYLSDKERYDHDYPEEDLVGWAQQLRAASSQAQQALLLFNNCRRAQAAHNARRMRDILEAMGMEVVAPFAPPPEVQQRSLFD